MENKKIDDKDLEDVSGAGADVDLQDSGSPSIGPRNGPAQPGDPGGPGADSPEGEGGGGGNQDLQI